MDKIAIVNLAVIFYRNKLAIDDWRQETRTLQRQKQYQAMKNGIKKGIYSLSSSKMPTVVCQKQSEEFFFCYVVFSKRKQHSRVVSAIYLHS